MSKISTILIVDDSRMVRATLSKHLQDHFTILEAADGQEAWDVLLKNPSINLLISDLSMPILDGLGLLRLVRESTDLRIASLPVMIISGEEDGNTRQRAQSFGATDFVSKSTDKAELLMRVNIALAMGTTTPVIDSLNLSPAPQANALFAVRFTELDKWQQNYGADGLTAILYELVLALRNKFTNAQVAKLADGLIQLDFNDLPARAVLQQTLLITQTLKAIQLQYGEIVLDAAVKLGFAHSEFDDSKDAYILWNLATKRMRQASLV